jgi:hypothetical protein
MNRRVKAVSTLLLASALLWFNKTEAATLEKSGFRIRPSPGTVCPGGWPRRRFFESMVSTWS